MVRCLLLGWCILLRGCNGLLGMGRFSFFWNFWCVGMYGVDV